VTIRALLRPNRRAALSKIIENSISRKIKDILLTAAIFAINSENSRKYVLIVKNNFHFQPFTSRIGANV
jgi:hypothetical protein